MIASVAAIALKAQLQSRQVLLSLAELKNFKRLATFIKHYVNK